LDYQFDDEHPGWPEYDPPPGTIIGQWQDESGEIQIEEINPDDIVVRCPRCGLDISANPLIPVTVQPFQSISDIKGYISQGEGIRLDFKQARPHPDSLGKSMAAFANTEGGKIILGVENAGSIIGFSEVATIEGKDKFQQFVRGIASRIQPKIDYQVNFVSEDQIYLAIITVPRGKSVHMYNNVYYVRELESSQPATHDQVARLFEERTKKPTQ